MRNFSKKLAFVLAAAMVVTAFAPAAQAKAADEMAINGGKSAKVLYVNEGLNHKGADTCPEGLNGNVSEYDFYVANKPANYKETHTFKWSSSNEDVITVGKAGLTTAVAVGKAEVVCEVTEKATGKTTTLKKAVTVKANAADVYVSNLDDVDGATVKAGETVDLNRTMVDENGEETTKRGEVVTDYTRWIAEPDTGVTIDQKTGKFTFGEDAVPGDYNLYCETYQSDKYNQTTATSDIVVVTYVVDNTFEVKQNSTTQLTVKFESPLKALSVADVSVIRTFGTYEYPQQVKSVALAKDGLSATVTVFASFVDKVNYIIKVKGYEDETMTASVGKPVRMDLVAKDKNPSFLINTGVATDIQCVFYDAADVIVPVSENVSLRLEKLSTTGDYYLAGKKLTIKKNTASAVVVAEYPGWFENGKRVGAFSHSQEFFAEDAPVVVPVAVSDYTIGGFNWWGTVKEMQVANTDKKLEVKLQRTDNQGGNDVYTFGTAYAPITGASITFTALNPDVCVINTSTGYLTANKPGTASFYVNLKTWNNSSKQFEETPFAVVTVEVKANSYLSAVNVENGAITVGTAQKNDFNQGKIEIIGYDQYNNAINIAKTNNEGDNMLKVECLSEGYGDKAAIATALVGVAQENVVADKAKDWDNNSANTLAIKFEANDLIDAMDTDKQPKAGEAATLYFKATYAGNKVTEFAITVQVPSGKSDDNYIQIMPNATYKDVVITADSKDAKSVAFEVFYMNNGVKVDDLALKAYPAGGADAATEGAYYFKVLKDGQDIWVNTAVSFDADADVNKVTLYPSKMVALSERAQKAVTAGALQVSYDGVGVGTYTFALFKCYVEGGVNVLVQEFASDVVIAVGDAGQYYISGDQRANYVENISNATGNDYSKADAAKILSCFNIKDRKGNDVVNPWTGAIGNYTYFVDYTAAADSKYVYVKDITFYEAVTGGYVAYTVTIDTALERK